MSVVYDESKTPFRLGPRLASGGQGVVWRLEGTDAYLFKQYHQSPTNRDSSKHRLLRAQSTSLINVAALPISLGFGDSHLNSQTGIFLPYVGGFEIFELYGTRSRIQRFPNGNFKFLIRVAYNLAVAFEELHNKGIIIGDVNEQNIKVMPDATVRFIDCDSFQIRDAATVYTSDVGTPLWTAPELHGINLTGLERDENHDLFGLSQLIFLLLFTGRHPFSGVPRTNKQLQPEEAIQQHAFAFAPKEMDLPLGPPPGCPQLDMLPEAIRSAFLRAFLKESVKPGARPKAREWRILLEKLSGELSSCSHTSSHVFWKGSARCPWCQIARDVGVDIFPPRGGNLPTVLPTSASDNSLINRLRNLRPFDFQITRPPPVLGLVASAIPTEPKGLLHALHKIISPNTWRKNWLTKLVEDGKVQLQKIEAEIKVLQHEQQSIILSYKREYAVPSMQITKLTKLLSQPGPLQASCAAEVMDEAKANELLHFLQRMYIRHDAIPQIGPARRATLSSFMIETAADIDSRSLARCGIPSNAIYNLLEWKKEQIARFKPKANPQPTVVQLREIELRFRTKIKAAQEEAATVETSVARLTRDAHEKHQAVERRIFQICRQKDQIAIDILARENQIRI